MSKTGPPLCSICGNNHSARDPHKWGASKDEKAPKNTKPNKKSVHNSKKPEPVYTIRQVSIRQLRSNMAKELSDLPFDIVRNGKVIGRVNK